MFKYYNPPDIQNNIETPAKSEDKDQVDVFAIVDNVLRHHDCDKCDIPDKITEKPMDTILEYKEIIVSLPEYQIKFLEQKSKERFIPSELIRRLLDKQMDEEFFKN